jgi:hypothetical protein
MPQGLKPLIVKIFFAWLKPSPDTKPEEIEFFRSL